MSAPAIGNLPFRTPLFDGPKVTIDGVDYPVDLGTMDRVWIRYLQALQDTAASGGNTPTPSDASVTINSDPVSY